MMPIFDAAPPTVAFPQPLPEPNDAGRAFVADFLKTDTVACLSRLQTAVFSPSRGVTPPTVFSPFALLNNQRSSESRSSTGDDCGDGIVRVLLDHL